MRKLLYLLATVTVSLLMVNCGGLNGPYSTKNLQKVLPPKNYNTTITEVVNAIYGKSKDEAIPTGRKKVGAMVGDYVEVGCNSVLNPGTVIGRHSNIYPTSCVRGVVPENSIFKTGGIVVTKK